MRAASESRAGTSMSVPLSTPLVEIKTVYSCVVGVPSKTNEKRLHFRVGTKFQTTLTLG